MGPSSDHTDSTWDSTNVYPGELFFNIPDQKLWIGNIPTPLEITLSGGTNAAVTSGSYNATGGTLTLNNALGNTVNVTGFTATRYRKMVGLYTQPSATASTLTILEDDFTGTWDFNPYTLGGFEITNTEGAIFEELKTVVIFGVNNSNGDGGAYLNPALYPDSIYVVPFGDNYLYNLPIEIRLYY